MSQITLVREFLGGGFAGAVAASPPEALHREGHRFSPVVWTAVWTAVWTTVWTAAWTGCILSLGQHAVMARAGWSLLWPCHGGSAQMLPAWEGPGGPARSRSVGVFLRVGSSGAGNSAEPWRLRFPGVRKPLFEAPFQPFRISRRLGIVSPWRVVLARR